MVQLLLAAALFVAVVFHPLPRRGPVHREIGEVLHLGVTTVKTHAAAMMTKTCLPNRIRLAVLAATHR